jgi:hypothetical protein
MDRDGVSVAGERAADFAPDAAYAAGDQCDAGDIVRHAQSYALAAAVSSY